MATSSHAPRRNSSRARRTSASAGRPLSLPPPPDRARRLLLVDDDDARRETLERLLRDEGYDVEVLASGDDVVEVVRASAPDLILLDVMLPGVSGLELCGDLRMIDEARLTPIILITASCLDEEDAVRGLLSGADDYVSTPTRTRELAARVRVQLRNRRDRELLRWATLERASFREAATRDALTGIGNRRVAERGLEEALSQASPFVVLVVDVDHFKSVNDRLGHSAGDAVLRRVADALARQARAGDTVARFGGEEFLVLATHAGAEHAFAIAERYRAAVEQLVLRPEIDLHGVTVSIGVATCAGRDAVTTPDALVAAADAALYAAKRGGRNRVVVAAEREPECERPELRALAGGKGT